MIVKFLNGDLMECDTATEVCALYGIHPSQLELTLTSEEDDGMMDKEEEKHNPVTHITHFGFIHPKPRVFLRNHHIIYNIPTHDDDDWDPWTVDYTYVYRDCVNTSILARLLKIDGSIGKHMQTVEQLWSEVQRDEQIDPGVEYSERYWLNLMCREGADRHVILYAISKLRALETSDQTVFEAAYVTYKCYATSSRSFVFSVLYDEGISHPTLWFERDFHHLDFSRILPHIEETMGRIWRIVGERGKTVNMVHTFEEGELDERLRRLAALSDSDEVAEWFKGQEDIRSHYVDVLCRNPNDVLIDYYLDHPEEVKWSSWIENTNKRSMLLPIPLVRLVKLTRNGDVYLTGQLAPHHLLHILSYFSPAVKVPLSTLIESFGKNDDVEVVFDTDLSISFLNGEKMWICPSNAQMIQRVVAKRRDVPVDCVELIDVDECRNYFALINKNTKK